MATEDTGVTDAEIESLMAELEEESAKIVGAQAEAKVPLKGEMPTGPSVADIQAEADRKELAKIKEEAAAAEKKAAQAKRGVEDTTIVVPNKIEPWEDEPAVVEKAVPDFVKRLQKPKPAPVEFEDVPDLDALAAEARLKKAADAKVDAAVERTKNSEERVLPGGGLVDVGVPTDRRVVPDGDGTVKSPTEPALIPSEDVPVTSDTMAILGLQHCVDVVQFRTDTRVTEATLDSCMIEQNGLRAFYGANAARAEGQASRMKVRFEVLEASMYEKHRKAFAASGEKATVQMVDSAVKTDPRWIKAKNTVIEAESIAAINKALVESLRDRASMIMQLSANRRDEFKGQSRVHEERDARDELRERALQAAQRAA